MKSTKDERTEGRLLAYKSAVNIFLLAIVNDSVTKQQVANHLHTQGLILQEIPNTTESFQQGIVETMNEILKDLPDAQS